MTKFKAIVFNVGQGDHSLISLPNGKFGIIDFHFDKKINENSEAPGMTFLDKILPTQDPVIDFIHITHFHRDHIKGIKDLLQWIKNKRFKLNEIWLPCLVGNLELRDTIQKIKQGPLLHEIIKQGRQDVLNSLDFHCQNLSGIHETLQELDKTKTVKRVYVSGIRAIETHSEDYSIHVVAPLAEHIREYEDKLFAKIIIHALIDRKYGKDPDDNTVSTIMCFKAYNQLFTFAGDATAKVLKDCLQEIEKGNYLGLLDLESVFIKVSHHGSNHSSDEAIWNKLLKKGKICHLCISSGEHNRFGHPHKKTLNDIKKSSVAHGLLTNIYVTSQSKIISTDPSSSFTIPTETVEWPKFTIPKSRKTNSQSMVFIKSGGRKKNKTLAKRLGFSFELSKDAEHVTVKELIKKPYTIG